MADIQATYVVDEGRSDLTPFECMNPIILKDRRQVLEVMESSKAAMWIAPRKEGLWWTVSALTELRVPARHSMLALEVFSPKSLVVLPALFHRVVCCPPVRLLPRKELAEVMAWEGRADMCIGGVVESRSGVVTLYRGNLQPVSMPLSFFKSPFPGLVADASRFEVTHYGQVLRFGNYGVNFEDVLYAYDTDFRRAKKAQRIVEDSTFGGALRRLRKQAGLRRGDFPGVSERTVARIERGEVRRPHGRTLHILAKKLGMTVEALERY